MTSPRVPAPAASVVVLAWNAGDVIRRALRALASQVGADRFETIVVWSGDARARDVAAGEFPGTVVVGREERLPTGATRNLGIAHARGRVIAFLAADCVPAPDWIARRLAAHREGHRCVGGAVLCAEPAGWLARVSHLAEYDLALPGRPRGVERRRPLYNLSFTRDIFDQYGVYDPTLAAGEDVIFNWRLVRDGVPALFDPEIRMWHESPEGLAGVVRHQFAHGRAYASVVRRPGYRGPRLDGPAALALIPAYPFVRLASVIRRTWTWDRANAWKLMPAAPVLFAGFAAAAVGMAREWPRARTRT